MCARVHLCVTVQVHACAPLHEWMCVVVSLYKCVHLSLLLAYVYVCEGVSMRVYQCRCVCMTLCVQTFLGIFCRILTCIDVNLRVNELSRSAKETKVRCFDHDGQNVLPLSLYCYVKAD